MERILIPCDCGCGVLEVNRDEDTTYISYYVSAFYEGQDTTWSRFTKKLKMIWYVIANKEFHYYDIVLSGDNEHDFERKMLKFLNR